MWNIYLTILSCALSTVTCKNESSGDIRNNTAIKTTIDKLSQIHPEDCPGDKTFIRGNSTCNNCLFCRTNSMYKYVMCPSAQQLVDCTHSLFWEHWRWQPNFDGNKQEIEIPQNSERKGAYVTQESNVSGKKPRDTPASNEMTGPVSNDTIPLPTTISLFVLSLLISIVILTSLIYLYQKKMKKQQSNYDAISTRRRHPAHYEDENYIRYTKFPTNSSSSRLKDGIRASWPRSGRSENRYLLEIRPDNPGNSRALTDANTDSTNTDNNQDSNSAQYVFIQTFSGGGNPSVSVLPPDATHLPPALSFPPRTGSESVTQNGIVNPIPNTDDV